MSFALQAVDAKHDIKMVPIPSQQLGSASTSTNTQREYGDVRAVAGGSVARRKRLDTLPLSAREATEALRNSKTGKGGKSDKGGKSGKGSKAGKSSKSGAGSKLQVCQLSRADSEARLQAAGAANGL